MPCYYTGTREGDLALDVHEARQELTRVTAMLCQLAQFCKAKHPKERMPHNIEKWWEEHQKIDAERRAREERKRRGETIGLGH